MQKSSQSPNMYQVDRRVAELYDQIEHETEDVEFLLRLIGARDRLEILEPFCGTGRIFIPLASAGHRVVGIDSAGGMLDLARSKLANQPPDVRERVSLIQADVVRGGWPHGFDLVVLGGNCFYELASPDEQEACVAAAAAALKPGGCVFVDNDHMERDLDPSWQDDSVRDGFPSGVCADGTRLQSTVQAIWWDVSRRLVRFRRHTHVTLPDGSSFESEYVQQKHPVSAREVRGWLEGHGLVIEQMYGDYAASPYEYDSPRAIFWARKL